MACFHFPATVNRVTINTHVLVFVWTGLISDVHPRGVLLNTQNRQVCPRVFVALYHLIGNECGFQRLPMWYGKLAANIPEGQPQWPAACKGAQSPSGLGPSSSPHSVEETEGHGGAKGKVICSSAFLLGTPRRDGSCLILSATFPRSSRGLRRFLSFKKKKKKRTHPTFYI